MALTGLAIAAALALAKSKMVDEPAAARQRKLAAATQAYSPWTHLQAQAPQDPNTIGQMLQYGATGAAIGSSLGKGGTAKDMSDASSTYKNMSPYSQPSVGAASGFNYNQDPKAFWSNPYGP